MALVKHKAKVATIEPGKKANPAARLDGTWVEILGGGFLRAADRLDDWQMMGWAAQHRALCYHHSRDEAEQSLYLRAVREGWPRIGCNLYLVEGDIPSPDDVAESFLVAGRCSVQTTKSILRDLKLNEQRLEAFALNCRDICHDLGWFLADVVIAECSTD
jgi:hypothetical protein